MLLKDWIDEHKDTYVYIGSNTGFFYCGTARECRSACKKFDENNINRAKRLIKLYSGELISAIKMIPRFEQDIAELQKKYNKSCSFSFIGDEIEKNQKKLDYHKSVLENNPVKISEQSMYIHNYTNVMNRNVIKTYKTTFKKPSGMNVIVEGGEICPYWDSEEYNADTNFNEEDEVYECEFDRDKRGCEYI